MTRLQRAFSSVFFLVFVAFSASCGATSFRGSPHYDGGPQACYQNCMASGMRMAAFVYMGQFSSGCVCAPTNGPGGVAGSTASGPAIAGVWMQMQEDARQQQQQR